MQIGEQRLHLRVVRPLREPLGRAEDPRQQIEIVRAVPGSERLDAYWEHVWMRPCTLWSVSAASDVEATSLAVARFGHAPW